MRPHSRYDACRIARARGKVKGGKGYGAFYGSFGDLGYPYPLSRSTFARRLVRGGNGNSRARVRGVVLFG